MIVAKVELRTRPRPSTAKVLPPRPKTARPQEPTVGELLKISSVKGALYEFREQLRVQYPSVPQTS